MKTKAEALENPAVGDRWRIDGAEYPWNQLTVCAQQSGEMRCRYTDGTASWMTRRLWAAALAGAEYLGNEANHA